MPSEPAYAGGMRVEGIDERRVYERDGTTFVVFVYTSLDRPGVSWAVYSYLITDADLPEALRWLAEELPTDANRDADEICCWSLGLVRDPVRPTSESDVNVTWIVGADVLNKQEEHLTPHERRIADEMLARRHTVALL